MILHNFDATYGFGAVFERVSPQIRYQKLPKPGAARPRAWFWDRIRVRLAQKQLQNHILHQNYEKS